MAHDERAQARPQEPGPIGLLEDRLVGARTVVRDLAVEVAGVDAPEPELLAAALETLASLATTMAAEARGGRVDR